MAREIFVRYFTPSHCKNLKKYFTIDYKLTEDTHTFVPELNK